MNQSLRRIYHEMAQSKSLEDCGIYVFQNEAIGIRSHAHSLSARSRVYVPGKVSWTRTN